jgi:hypothetical protein
MNTERRESLHRKFSAMETRRLLQIVIHESDDYAADALEIVEGILEARGLDREGLEQLRAMGAQEAAQEETLAMERMHEEYNLIQELDADGSYCHLCQSPEPAEELTFGLAAIRDVTGSSRVNPASAVISAGTMFLFGAGVILRDALTESSVLLLRLRLCEACARRKRWLGAWNLSEDDYSEHPAWPRATDLGFDHFLPPNAVARRRGHIGDGDDA